MSVIGPIGKPVIPPIVAPVGLVGLPWDVNSKGSPLLAPSAPSIVGAVTIGGTLTITPGAGGGPVLNFAEYLDGVATGRTVAATGAPVNYTVVTGDITGGAIGFKAVGPAQSSALSNTVAYTPTQFSNLLYLIDNSTGQDGAYASIVDRSPGARTLTVSGSAPSGWPRHWEEAGEPVINFNGALSQTAQDQGAGAISYVTPMHLAGSGFIYRGELRDQVADGQVVGTLNGSSLACTFSLSWDGTNLAVYVSSTTGGGTFHIGPATGATTTAVRPGDLFTLTFLHQTDKTWTIDIVREARSDQDVRATTHLNGSYSSTIAAGDAPGGLTFSDYTGLGGSKKSHRLHTFAAFTIGASTTADVADMQAYLSNRCNFAFLTFAATGAPVYPGDYVDSTHWDASGHLVVATAGITAEQAAASARGWTTTKNVGVIGDSRFADPAADAFRALLAAGSYTGGFAHLGYGPIDDGSGNALSKFHFARSAYTTRSVAVSTQLGHSQLSPHSASVNVFINSATGTKPLVDLWHVMNGVNEIVGITLEVINTWDFVDALVSMCEYAAQQRALEDGGVPAFVLYTEPVTGSTTTGIAQRVIRSRNRAYHAGVAYLRSLGLTVLLVECNDESYNA